MAEGGELRTYNSAQGIATQRDLNLILWHTEAMRQVRTGQLSINFDNTIVLSNGNVFNKIVTLINVIGGVSVAVDDHSMFDYIVQFHFIYC